MLSTSCLEKVIIGSQLTLIILLRFSLFNQLAISANCRQKLFVTNLILHHGGHCVIIVKFRKEILIMQGRKKINGKKICWITIIITIVAYNAECIKVENYKKW